MKVRHIINRCSCLACNISTSIRNICCIPRILLILLQFCNLAFKTNKKIVICNKLLLVFRQAVIFCSEFFYPCRMIYCKCLLRKCIDLCYQILCSFRFCYICRCRTRCCSWIRWCHSRLRCCSWIRWRHSRLRCRRIWFRCWCMRFWRRRIWLRCRCVRFWCRCVRFRCRCVRFRCRCVRCITSIRDYLTTSIAQIACSFYMLIRSHD